MGESKLAAVGAFVIGGLLLFAVGLFMIADRRLLLTDRFTLNTEFNRVTGLQVGTIVRVSGLDAGEVTQIQIPSTPSEGFVVSMRVREDVHQLIRTDSTASILTDGIVGSAFIQIGDGTETAAIVPADGTIQGNDPVQLSDLIEEGRNTFRTVTAEILEVKDDLAATLAALTETAGAVNDVVVDVGADAEVIASEAADLMTELSGVAANARAIAAGIRDGEGTVGRLLTDDALYEEIRGLSGEARVAVANLRETTDHLRDAVARVSAEGGPGDSMIADVRVALADTREIMTDLSESTEALKRNFLFSGYFEDRGFFDLDALTPEEYRAGVLEIDERAPISIWLASDVLFETGDAGLPRLTDEGRQRVDAAMAHFLRYPRDSVLVVEGYADDPDARTSLLLSEDRAEAVRSYVADRFRRDLTITGTMPLGADAAGSPSGDGRWSGVALTIFVRPAALEEGEAAGQPAGGAASQP